MPSGLTPLLSKSLDSQSLDKHRAMVGFELEVLSKKVDRFGWDRDRGTRAHDRQMLDWMDTLQDYPLDEVKAACKAAVEANPNKMPNEGHVKAQIISARAGFLAARPKPVAPADDRRPVTPEEAEAILASAGFNLNRFGGGA